MQRQCANSQLETTFAKGTKLAKLPAFAAHKNAGALTFPKKNAGHLKLQIFRFPRENKSRQFLREFTSCLTERL